MGDSGNQRIILHQIGRAPFAPSLTPYAVKLETYFRMAKVPYKNEHSRKKSSKGKFPWIEYNGVEVADTSFIINFINEKFNINLNSHMSSADLALARAFQKLIEDSLYWCLVLERWQYDKHGWLSNVAGIPKIGVWAVRRSVVKQVYQQGTGRHSYEEVMKIMEDDLKAISDFLGEKPFLFGEQPGEIDCVLFGQLSQFRWQVPHSKGESLVTEKYTNLREYCDRMKDKFWPDWDECITKGDKNRKLKD